MAAQDPPSHPLSQASLTGLIGISKKHSSPAAVDEAQTILFALLDKWTKSSPTVMSGEENNAVPHHGTIPYIGLLRELVLQSPEDEGRDSVLRTIFQCAFSKLVPDLGEQSSDGPILDEILQLTKALTSRYLGGETEHNEVIEGLKKLCLDLLNCFYVQCKCARVS